MRQIIDVPVGDIRANPYRDLATYPWIESKIETLTKSFREVGFFEGIIARPTPDGTYELWFGHHRLETAKRLNMPTVPLIIRDATDEQMVKAMAHENAEDFGTDFLIQLNTWEGGIKYLQNSQQVAKNPEPLEIARLLGMARDDDKGKHGDRLDTIAEACNAAHALIAAGHMNRTDLRGLTVSAARSLTQSMLSQMERVDKMAKISKAPATSVAAAKENIATAGKVTAKNVRAGKIGAADIRSSVATNAFSEAAKDKRVKDTPLLSAFAELVCKSIGKVLVSDTIAKKLVEVIKIVPQLTLGEDFDALEKIRFELGALATRSERMKVRLTPAKDKLVALENKKG